MKQSSAISQRFGRVLSVDPRSRRVAWAYFQDSELVNCSVKTFRQDGRLARVANSVIPYVGGLMEQVSPHAIVVPRVRGGGVRSRGNDSTRAIRAIVREAVKQGIAVHVIGIDAVNAAFGELRGERVKNKEDIHREILDRFPELTPIAPESRMKTWHPESYFTPLFNTVAMYLAWAHQLAREDADT